MYSKCGSVNSPLCTLWNFKPLANIQLQHFWGNSSSWVERELQVHSFIPVVFRIGHFTRARTYHVQNSLLASLLHNMQSVFKWDIQASDSPTYFYPPMKFDALSWSQRMRERGNKELCDARSPSRWGRQERTNGVEETATGQENA